MRHPHRFPGIGRGEGSVEGDAPNVASRDRETRETIDVQGIGRCFRGENFSPDFSALRLIGKGELDDEAQPAQERRV